MEEEASALHVLRLLHPLVDTQYNIAKNAQCIEGVRELVLGEDDTSFLSSDLKEILKQSDEIKRL